MSGYNTALVYLYIELHTENFLKVEADTNTKNKKAISMTDVTNPNNRTLPLNNTGHKQNKKR